jgi:hypothetical protein
MERFGLQLVASRRTGSRLSAYSFFLVNAALKEAEQKLGGTDVMEVKLPGTWDKERNKQ